MPSTAAIGMPHRASPEIEFHLSDCPSIPLPGRILLTTPPYYEVAYVINPHMAAHVGTVDSAAAFRQWRGVRAAYQALDLGVQILEGEEGLPDMVFCANQTLPFYRPDSESRGVLLSHMFAPQRRDEVTHFKRHFTHAGYEVRQLPAASGAFLEGTGDAIWHPGKYLLWGGHGIRTDREAFDAVAQELGVRIVLLQLCDEHFYHLDTCFCPLDERTAMIFPGAFGPAGLAAVERLFERVLAVPEEEARHLLACNAHCPDGRHVLIQRGCTVTNELLCAAGFEPVELETQEFLKAGASVFCMKLAYW